MLIAAPHIRIQPDELRFTFVRSSGPGGQNVNKVNSKAVLHWNVSKSMSLSDDVRQRFLARFASRVTIDGDLVLTSQRSRDQRQNHRDCLEKLQAMLVSVAVPPKKRKKTKPTKSSVARRRTQKLAHSRKKQHRQKPSSED